MWTYIKIFPHAFTVKFRIGSPKTARNEQVCTPKSHTGSKFSKTSLGLLYTRGMVVAIFLFGVRWRHSRPPYSELHNMVNWRKDSVANYGSIWTLFSPSVRGYTCTLQYPVRSSVGKWHHKIRKFAVQIFQNTKFITWPR